MSMCAASKYIHIPVCKILLNYRKHKRKAFVVFLNLEFSS